MITYTFIIKEDKMLQLQDTVKHVNARFAQNPFKMSNNEYFVKINFENNSDLMRFFEERNRAECDIVEIDKPKSFISKLFNRVKLLFRR